MGKETEQYSFINDNEFVVKLIEVSYKGINDVETNEEEVSYKLQTRDSYKFIEISRDNIIIEFKRELFFEPSAIFEVEIRMNIIYDINSMDKKIDAKDIEEEAKKNIEDLLVPVSTQTSVLLSILTNVESKIPIVSPPFPLIKDVDIENKNE